MDLKLYLQNSNNGTIYDISQLASTIKVTKNIEGTAGQLTVLLQKDPNNILKIANGSIISFIVDGTGIFFGYVFKEGTDATKTYKITAYDQLRYFKNEEVYVTQNLTASDIFTKVCLDNTLKFKVKASTNYIPPAYIHDKKTLYQIIDRGRKLANINDKKQYYITDEFGVLTWSELSLEKTNIILGEQSLLTDYKYERSIDDDTFNQIKIYRENEKTGKREIWIFKDSDNIKRWGKLQMLHKLDDIKDTSSSGKGEKPLTFSEIQELGNNYLKVKNREKQTLKLNAIGINELVAGKGFRCVIASENINQDMWIISSTHTYNKDSHTMELEVKI